jgi:carbon storage regulator CsrA
MLVLTRKLQQQIKIGEQITVTVLRIKGNTVRVGVSAPREVRVVRGELPKDGASAEAALAAETILNEEAVLEIDGEMSELALEAEESVSESPEAAAVSASHLPLRRIRNRHGAAPLKQLIASCTTLAK